MLTAAWLAISAVTSKLPWWLWTGAILAVGVWWWGEHNYNKGVADTKQEFSNVHAGVVTLQNKITVRVEKEYIDRVQTVYKQGKTIIKEVPLHIPSTDFITSGWRVLYNSAVQGVIPDATAKSDDRPVPLRQAAEVAVTNLTTCRAEIAKLASLQSWVRQQQEAAQ